MIGATMLKRSRGQAAETSTNFDPLPVGPKQFFDFQGNNGRCFQNYVDKLSTMFPAFTPSELFAEFQSNQLDILGTVEALTLRSRQLEIEKLKNETSFNIEEPSHGGSQSQRPVDYILSCLSTCTNYEQAKQVAEAFIEKIVSRNSNTELEQTVKKLEAEKSLCRTGFLAQKKKLSDLSEENLKIKKKLESSDKELESSKKLNYILLNKIKELESRGGSDFLSSHRPIY